MIMMIITFLLGQDNDADEEIKYIIIPEWILLISLRSALKLIITQVKESGVLKHSLVKL